MSSKKSDPDTSSIEKGARELEHDDIVLLADQKALDISLALPGVVGVHDDSELDPADSLRVKRKLDRRILPLLFSLYTRTSYRVPLISHTHLSPTHSTIYGQKCYFDFCHPRFPPRQQPHE